LVLTIRGDDRVRRSFERVQSSSAREAMHCKGKRGRARREASSVVTRGKPLETVKPKGGFSMKQG
jgi:hypothetical protein